VLDLPVSQPLGTGQVQLPVTYGKTYTAQLKTPLVNQPLGAPLTITTKRPPERPDFKVDFGCMVQCINEPGVDAHGGWAQFDITTTETALMTLEASTTEPNPDGTWSNPATVAAFSNSLVPVQNWKPQLLDLESSTTYYYVVRADDGKGKQVKTGSFKTLTRRVEVTFAEIEMIDDSDGALAGDCDCYFYFNAGNEEPKTYGSFENPKSIASGTTVHPNMTFTINNAPSEIRIRAQGNDNDTEENEFCPAQTGPPEAFTGAANWKSSGNFQECLEWAGDQVLVSVSRQGSQAAPGDVDEQFTEPFTISVGGELVYKVHGTYKVTYV